MSDKLDKIISDLANVRGAFNEIFTSVTKAINLLEEAQVEAKNLKQELKQKGGNK